MDHQVPYAITVGLRLRDVDVVTAHEDGRARCADPALLDRATELGRLLFSRDEDLLAEAVDRQRSGRTFGGVVYAHQLGASIGKCVSDLELIAKTGDQSEFADRVTYLPL